MRTLTLLTIFCGYAFGQTAASVAPNINPQFFDASTGVALPCNGCKLYSYTAGTLTPLATYTDYTGTVTNSDPTTLDSGGYTPSGIWIKTQCYKFILKTSALVTIWTRDQVCDNAQLIKAALATTSNVSGSNGAALVGYEYPGSSTAQTVQTRLQATVTINDFGADPTGVSDASSAVAAAIAASNYVTAKCGTYALNGTTITIPTGVNFVMPHCASFTSTTTAQAFLISAPLRQQITLAVARTLAQWPTGSDTTSVGVEIDDSQEGIYDLTVTNFNTNILLTNVSGDTTNNTFTHIESQDGDYGVHLLPAGGNGVNQNNFLYAHIRINSGATCPAGSPVAGSKGIWHSSGSDNANIWINPNLEGGCVAQSLRVSSNNNLFITPRFEGNVANAVTLDAGTTYNTLINPFIDSGLLSWIHDLGQNTIESPFGYRSDTQGAAAVWYKLNKNGVTEFQIAGSDGSITTTGSATVSGTTSSAIFVATGTAPTLNNSGFGTGATITGVGSVGRITTGSGSTSTSGQVLFGTAYPTNSNCWAQDINAGTYLSTTGNSSTLNIFATSGNLPTAHTLAFGCIGW